MESLGTSFIEALMILINLCQFFWIEYFNTYILFGDWDYGLIVGALIWSIGGTFLIILGLILRLVGVEYDLQKKKPHIEKYL